MLGHSGRQGRTFEMHSAGVLAARELLYTREGAIEQSDYYVRRTSDLRGSCAPKREEFDPGLLASVYNVRTLRELGHTSWRGLGDLRSDEPMISEILNMITSGDRTTHKEYAFRASHGALDGLLVVVGRLDDFRTESSERSRGVRVRIARHRAGGEGAVFDQGLDGGGALDTGSEEDGGDAGHCR